MRALSQDTTTIASQRDVGHFIEYFETFLSMSIKSAVVFFERLTSLPLYGQLLLIRSCYSDNTIKLLQPEVMVTIYIAGKDEIDEMLNVRTN